MAKRKPEEAKAGCPEWLATYGDLVTLVLCFFVLLYSMSSIDVAKFQSLAASFSGSIVSISDGGSSDSINVLLGSGIMEMPIMKKEDYKTPSEDNIKNNIDEAYKELQKITSDFKTYFAKENLQDSVTVQNEGTFVRITFPDGILFDRGKANLLPDVYPILSAVADELINYPDNQIMIEGHTDTDPIRTVQYPNNSYLSSARAIEVGMYFITEKGMDPKRIESVGKSEYWPVAENDTAENKAKNRRVEIKIMSSEAIRYDQ